MKKLLLFLALIFIPTITFAAIGVGWSAASPTTGVISPLQINGTGQAINVSALSTSTIANDGGVLNPTSFSGSDIGAQVNTAFSQAPTYGTAVFIPAPNSGTNWSYTTGITDGTSGKPLRITCAIGGGAINYATNGTVLLWNSTTGTSTSFDPGQGPNESGSGSGIVNCNLQGTNGTTARATTGIQEGVSNGDFNGYVNGVNVSGFGTGIYYGPSTSFNQIFNSTINLNGRNVSEPNVGGANCENMRVLDSIIADANNQAGGATSLKGFWVQVSGNCQENIGFNSFDDNQIYASQFGGTADVWNLTNNHHEDPNGTAYPMIANDSNNTNVVWNIADGDFMNDDTSGQPDFMEVTGNVNFSNFTIDGNNNVNVPVTRVVNALASSTVITWSGLTNKGAGARYVYGNIPMSPFGIGSDIGQPSLMVASSTVANGVGIVDIATSTDNTSVAKPAVLNIGSNPLSTNASTTINMTHIQIQGQNSAGTVTCAYVVGTTWVMQAGACNN